ncbi:MAG TPA: 6-phosphogluconolactonase [Solirubrobacteraceae bacterium]|nr:6-phosphogluconolactonase [Solirubrobacteraceae bacterium]
MRLIRCADAGGVSEQAAALIEALLAEALEERGRAHLALAGGNTPGGAYARLSLPDWAGVELWFGDERCVGPADPQSNYLMVEQTLLDHAEGALVHRIEGERGAEAAAAAYADLLVARAGGPLPVLDVVLLGIGEDGHTASLFPGAATLQAGAVVCVPVHDSPKPPPDRVSMSLEVLRLARCAILLVSGAGKAEALAGALGDPTTAVPASLLERERLVVIADEAALGG